MWPKSVVFQTPPLLTPIRNSFGLPGMPVAPTVRPPRNGPMHRHFSAAYALHSNGGAATAEVAASTSEQTTKMRYRNDTAGPLAENWTADPDVTSPPGEGKPMTTAESVGERVGGCRRAQAAWSAPSTLDRLRQL